jgi:hypothetical protein
MPIQSQKIKRGGAGECASYKLKDDCEKNDCLWGKTGRCSKKRDTKNKKNSASFKDKEPSPVVMADSHLLAKKSKTKKVPAGKKVVVPVIPNAYPFSWLEVLGQSAAKPNLHFVANGTPGHQVISALRGIANEAVSINHVTIARVYLEYKSYEVKPGDYSSNKYYCMEVAGGISWISNSDGDRSFVLNGHYTFIQAWGPIGERPEKRVKVTNSDSLPELEVEFKKMCDDKLKKKYKLMTWNLEKHSRSLKA